MRCWIVLGVVASALCVVSRPAMAQGPAFYATSTVDQTVTSGVGTKITFNTVLWDTNNNFAQNRFTPNVGGKYLVVVNAGCSNDGGVAVYYCDAVIKKNGAVVSQAGPQTSGTNYLGGIVTSIIDMNGTTDYLEAWVGTNSNTLFGYPSTHPYYGFTYFTASLLASSGGGSVGGTGTAGYIPYWSNSTTQGSSVLYQTSGNVGIGTQNPTNALQIGNNPWATAGYGAAINSTIYGAAIQTNSTGPLGLFIGNASNATGNNAIDVRNNVLGTPAQILTVQWAGNVGIGTASPAARLHVAGNVQVDGNIGARYQDVAEWVKAKHPLEPGTVVVANDADAVDTSKTSYDTAVVGVVSPRPGVVLGEAGDGKVLVAQSGRVRVKVDASFGAVRVGDLLVTSPKEGVAMKSEPLDIGGTTLHRPGTLLGKALEPLASGQADILVLLTLQ